MVDTSVIFGWKSAMIWHTIFYSLALLQEMPQLGMLWLIINTFVFLLLLRAVYGPADDEKSNRAMAWYFYVLSVGTDFLSLCVNGTYILHADTFMAKFVVVMACFMLIPKPFYAFFLLKSLKDDGFNPKEGLSMKRSPPGAADAQYGGFSELDQQVSEQGYNPAQVVVSPASNGPPAPPPPPQATYQPAQQSPQTQSTDGTHDMNRSLMDDVAHQQDVFAPGQ
mmetsp:Transcript_22447/g.36006  ORF Transcript_22447/g.36006 Transcript_22447/m.36006 type:complete len:223 (+) Transcript_22447:119-787(+)|eukprot:CAMPEP_0202712868 /NCGR_PEP_ID=MMETSP1385-20130828/46843_1 /ASSEMBLY_ACC=CAM_ASM_000861 /TAXON_ID=933848 /ORGANISM="Elphidium margaritaceum" /LENGTH=222 /DNA_ID=CAMNT_0049373037 /DNA_START=61 /DNA_END=729 /DNA_ORIENTATION=+